MSDPIVLEFDHLPAVAPAYVRAVTARGSRLSASRTIPAIEAHVDNVQATPRQLRRYRCVCGFADSGSLPVTYPHVLAFPVHMAVMTHRAFPLKLLGLVHVRNAISQHRAIGAGEALDFVVRVGGHRVAPKGVEFDLTTEARTTGGELVWDSVSTMLSRGKVEGSTSGKPKKKSQTELEDPHFESWEVPANTGRRYARSAGDTNPIHLSMVSAKLLGFPRAIAHGMWLKARTVAELEPHIQQGNYNLSVAFKRPVLLPSTVKLGYSAGEQGIDFVLRDAQGKVPHMAGAITYAAD